MKFLRYGPIGQEKPACIAPDGTIRDLSDQIDDLSGAALTRLNTLRPDGPIVTPDRIGAPIANPGKILCIGLNYSDHAAEAGMQPPPEPILFQKATSSLSGPNDPLTLPRSSTKTDWEVELAVIISTPAKYVSEADALSHVAGYAAFNDISERAFQTERAGQWTKGKSCDGFAPLGPYLVTPDEAGDPQNMTLSLWVNGTRHQHGTTATMIFGVAHIISYLSQFMTLHPGDIIATGTPPGVGMGMKPPLYLRPGDVMELEIDGLGRQRQTVHAPD